MRMRLADLIPYILYLLLLGFHQVILSETFSIWDVRLALTPLIFTLVAIYKDQGVATAFAATSAFVMSSNDPGAAAGTMIVAAAVALGITHYRGRLNLDSLAARLALIAVGCLVYEIARVTLITTQDLFFTYVRYMLPSVVVTSAVGLIVLLFKDGTMSYAKFRRLF